MAGLIGRAAAAAAVALMTTAGLAAAPGAQASPTSRTPAAPAATPLATRPGMGAFSSFGRLRAPAAAPGSQWRSGLLTRGGALPRPARPPVRSALSHAGGWRVEPTPNPVKQHNGTLAADSCAGPSACIAVGDYENGTGTTVALAEQWNGAAWSVQRIPNPPGATATVLNGVSCASAAACVAVGFYFTAAGGVLTVAEGWNGTRWQIQPSAGPVGAASGLYGVSCTSAQACTAVGIYDTSNGTSLTLAERWDGSSWTIQADPISVVAVPSELLAVSCAGPSACTAVGSFENSSGASQPLAMAWDGTTWADQTVPVPARATGSGFSAVSCAAPGVCIAAGGYNKSSGEGFSLAEAWNGTAWTIQVAPMPARSGGSELFGVSCTAVAACTAVGAYLADESTAPATPRSGIEILAPMATAWNGVAWHVTSAVNPAGSGGGALDAVSCTAAAACVAVGSYTPEISLAGITLAEGWNGTGWTLQPSPSPVGANSSQLNAVACPSARVCIAVGYYARNAATVDTLAEIRNGSHWRIVASPDSRGAAVSFLNAVACASPRACVAVGASANSRGAQRPLAEAWNGSAWRIVRVPEPSRHSGLALYSVSCSSARACTAVGYYSKHGRRIGLAERWDGSRWSIQAAFAAAKRTWLLGVSCPSASFCTAVGYRNKGTGDAQPLAETWNGEHWRAWDLPRPAGSPGGALAWVSCSSPGACTAAGASFSSNGAPLAERWNGHAWRPQAPVAPDGYQTSTAEVDMPGVSCPSARSCTAVGDFTPNNAVESFAEAWDGTSWRLEFIALPVGASQSLMSGVSCVTARCTAVGSDMGPSGTIVTLADVTSS